jgi:hypothetical protein
MRFRPVLHGEGLLPQLAKQVSSSPSSEQAVGHALDVLLARLRIAGRHVRSVKATSRSMTSDPGQKGCHCGARRCMTTGDDDPVFVDTNVLAYAIRLLAASRADFTRFAHMIAVEPLAVREVIKTW